MTILDQRLTAAAPAAARVRAARVRRRLRVRPTVVLAIAWLAVVLLAALAPGLIAPGDPYAANGADSLLGPSPAHPFGTDQIGRDLLTRVVHGTGLSVQATLVAVVGLVINLVSALLLGQLLYVLLNHVSDAHIGHTTVEAKAVGISLFGPYLLAVELASMLLLAALVAAYHLGRHDAKEPTA